MGKLTRRIFLGLGVAAAGGLALGVWWVRRPYGNPLAADATPGEAVFSPWLKIAETGEITVIVPRAEMGQGVATTLAALVAEELDVTLDRITVDPGPASAAYYNEGLFRGGPALDSLEATFAEKARATAAATGAKIMGIQLTAGSSSTMDAFVKMRAAGAAARIMLTEAAARRLGVPADRLITAEAAVTDPVTGVRLTYAELAAEAARLDPPADPPLRPAADWKLLGQSQPRVDMRAKITGAPVYAIDLRLPDMLHATVRINPHHGGGVRAADLSAARAVPGVVEVVEIDHRLGRGFGVIARDTWSAFRGAEAIAVEWDRPDTPGDEAAQAAALTTALAEAEGFVQGAVGDAPRAIAAAPADEVIEADYAAPFLSHLTLEPMNATARFAGGRLEVWTGTQAPGIVQDICGPAVGLSAGDVTVHQTLMGGGFGRRAEADAALYAALIARHAHGRPVKLTWSRTEDLRHDAYRPMARGRFRAHVRPGEGPVAVAMKLAAPAVSASAMKRLYPSLPAGSSDRPLLEGLWEQPYRLGALRVEGAAVDLGVPVGFWRSVGHSQNGFFLEGFLDEVAAAARLDPLDLRFRLLDGPDAGPARGVLEAVAQMSDWGAADPGRAKGVAFFRSYGTAVAAVAEVSGDADAIRVERLWLAADPGRALDPRIFAAQISGGAVMGLSAAIGEVVHFENGAVVEENLDAYRLLTLGQCPQVEVRVLETAPRLGGAGEPGLPPAAPALANAIHALTGRRLRSMPFDAEVGFA